MSTTPDDDSVDGRVPGRADMLYSAALLVAAVAVLTYLVDRNGFLTGTFGWWSAAFFFAFSLYTITMGFPHPGFGHVSFDRVGQVAAILVLGPVDAAVICGLASLVYPWQRLLRGEPLYLVTMASMHNAGLMTFVVLGGGMLYTAIGGPVPLLTIDLQTASFLLALIFVMQIVNDLGMLLLFRLRGENPGELLTLFTTAVEIVSALIAILVALVVSLQDAGIIVLLLVVLSLGMMVLKRYAEMRSRLETIVAERTAELRMKTLELERQATRDKLTGLYNRHYVDEFLERQLERARRSGESLTIALADVDHFKRINDRYSHAAGDRVLVHVAELLRRRCRQSDVVARYGGEEFLICFPDTSGRFAGQICDELRLAIEATDWTGIIGESGPRGDLRITMSFGIAVAAEDARAGELIDEADLRLYRAKRAGRNRVVA